MDSCVFRITATSASEMTHHSSSINSYFFDSLKSENQDIFSLLPSLSLVSKLDITNLNIVNKTQLPFLGFTKHITFDVVNYSI